MRIQAKVSTTADARPISVRSRRIRQAATLLTDVRATGGTAVYPVLVVRIVWRLMVAVVVAVAALAVVMAVVAAAVAVVMAVAEAMAATVYG